MKILLTGRNGQVGWELERSLARLGEVLAMDRAQLDIADPDAIRRVLRELKPDAIVNAAAYTAVDKAESEPDLAMQVNGVAPGVLAEEAHRLDAMLVHYSTDYVFDGSKRTPYLEQDATNPLSVYGRSKLAGEQAIEASGCRCLILRTSWVYAPRGRNFFLTIARKAAAGEALRVVADQFGVPTTAAFLAAATVELMRLPGDKRLCHLVPGGATSWCGFAQAIADRIRPGLQVTPIRTGEFPTSAHRPAWSVLDNSRAAAWLGGGVPTWQSLLDDCVATYRALESH